MSAKPTLKVVLDEAAPEPTEIIAAAIIKVSDGFAKLMQGGLNRRALVVLLKDRTNVPAYQINMILDTLPQLKEIYCAKTRKKP